MEDNQTSLLQAIVRRLDAMDSRFDGFAKSIDSIDASQRRMELRIEAVERDVAVLKQDVGSLKTIERDVAALERDVAALKLIERGVAVLEQEVAALTDKVNAIPDLNLLGHRVKLILESGTDMRHELSMLRAALNDFARTNVTSGEIGSIYTDLQRLESTGSQHEVRLRVLEDKIVAGPAAGGPTT